MSAQGRVMPELNNTQVIIDGVEWPDFGFRSFTEHLNDYDLFRHFAPCYWANIPEQIAAHERGQIIGLLTQTERKAMGL